jgi:hypothetical protein
MRRLYLILPAFTVALVLTASCRTAPASAATGAVSAADVHNFVSAWKQWSPADSTCLALEPYWRSATPGLEFYARKFDVTQADLCSAVRKKPTRYAALAAEAAALDSASAAIRVIYEKFRALHPLEHNPSVYLVVGNGISAGSTTRGKHPVILIGAEVVNSVRDLPWIVAHELVHTQQDYPWFGSMNGGPKFLRGSLLRHSIAEGSADFIASLITGKPVANAWAEEHEGALWKQFRHDADSRNYGEWLYNGWNRKALGDRPPDLGYWMGYRITQSYYDHATDKAKAISDILLIHDFPAFLAASKYDGRGKRAMHAELRVTR